MRRTMEYIGSWQAKHVPKRKRPLYYECVEPGWSDHARIAVLGHYETKCGGCDTVGSARVVFDLTNKLLADGYTIILQEGIMVSEDVKWTSQYKHGVRALFMTTSLEKCLMNIVLRRKSGGSEEPLDFMRTLDRYKSVIRARPRLMAAGVNCRRVTMDQAPKVASQLVREACRATQAKVRK